MNTIKKEFFNWPVLDIDLEALVSIHDKQVNPGNQYGSGRKIPLKTTPENADGMPVDCSGYVRWLLYQASSDEAPAIIIDGSVRQHDAVRAEGFKVSTVESAKMQDNILRIAFLAPRDGGGIGHVALILNGETIESAGGTGPDSRPWTGRGWQARATVYVLAVP